ncbi:hypothetical protein [Halomonas nitroreducens]|uniref:hypothetical protein n=1 Tax=Halomonas nitroreducens TaxID=447425 RepID=UPI001FE5A929|nr:hypothetical protein [Halomonas nitroreducens]
MDILPVARVARWIVDTLEQRIEKNLRQRANLRQKNDRPTTIVDNDHWSDHDTAGKPTWTQPVARPTVRYN